MLTYRQAAARLGVNVATIKRWRRNGMPMGTDAHGRRVVRLDVLQAWYRDRLAANPTHQARARRVETIWRPS